MHGTRVGNGGSVAGGGELGKDAVHLHFGEVEDALRARQHDRDELAGAAALIAWPVTSCVPVLE